MKILVLNNGSSSIKYQLYQMDDRVVLAKGVVERVGTDSALLKHQGPSGEAVLVNIEARDHRQGLQAVIEQLTHPVHGAVNSMDEIAAIGHRVVHGGEKFQESTLITDEVIAGIEAVSHLAPLHNPHNLTGIMVCAELMPDKPQAAVFDTVFHQTMPPHAYMYALPYHYYEDHGIRKYGFHGTSHKYVARRAAALMGRPLEETRIITCHLGNGASIAAVKNGQSIDTTMGFTPLEGLMMGTRCGDLDPAIIPFLMKQEGVGPTELDRVMNNQSGLLGVSGISNDLRDIEKAAQEGSPRAQLALDMYVYRIQKYIGAYLMSLGGADAIVFTAGAGENQSSIRKKICAGLAWLNVHIDDEHNQVRGAEHRISTAGSPIEIWVIPTNEELMIAEETMNLVSE
ncbi:MAG: acetate kinase [Firmicutes bacterium]|nr:acetate kinase [Bacillota bacterium]